MPHSVPVFPTVQRCPCLSRAVPQWPTTSESPSLAWSTEASRPLPSMPRTGTPERTWPSASVPRRLQLCCLLPAPSTSSTWLSYWPAMVLECLSLPKPCLDCVSICCIYESQITRDRFCVCVYVCPCLCVSILPKKPNSHKNGFLFLYSKTLILTRHHKFMHLTGKILISGFVLLKTTEVNSEPSDYKKVKYQFVQL